MHVQLVKFTSALTEEEAIATAESRLPEFQKVPGLVQKYYVKGGTPKEYCGIYIWESADAMKAFRASELAATIPSAYQVVGAPQIDIFEMMMQLRD